jgi:diguanylate cyclase (GGDEF)-like protein
MSSGSWIPIEWIDAFGVGVYLLFAIVHLDHWRRRREGRSHLWLALASLGALAVDLTGMLLRSSNGAEPRWVITVNVAGVAVTTACLVELVSSLTGRRTPSILRFGEAAAVALALAGGTVVWPRLAIGSFAICLILLLVSVVRAISAGLGGDAESRTVGAGLLALLSTLIADLLMELHVLPQVSGLPVLGFTTLFLAAARAINERSHREYAELVLLREELEQRVRERTAELEEANRQLAVSSRTDALTSLPNRRGFTEAAEQELVRAVRAGEPWTIAMADLDWFKQVNDRHGHAAGDIVLTEAAAVLRRSLRAQDLVARWGGEEFILLLPSTDSAGAVRAAETVRRAIGSHRFPHGVTMTISVGIAQHVPGDSLDTTIAVADRALYRAKIEGRDRVVS